MWFDEERDVWLWIEATAAADEPVFGIGGHVGSWFLPAAFPYEFPKAIREYDFQESPDGQPDDVDGDGRPDRTTLTSARGDVGVGMDFYTWMDEHIRFGVTTHAALAPRFSDLQVVLVVERTGYLGRASSFIGGGIGFGTTSWQGKDEDERLRLPSYPLRADAGITFLVNESVGVELRLIGQVLIPSNHWYTDLAGNAQTITAPPTYYATAGIQLGFLVGRLD